jgi:hypothetical protein
MKYWKTAEKSLISVGKEYLGTTKISISYVVLACDIISI